MKETDFLLVETFSPSQLIGLRKEERFGEVWAIGNKVQLSAICDLPDRPSVLLSSHLQALFCSSYYANVCLRFIGNFVRTFLGFPGLGSEHLTLKYRVNPPVEERRMAEALEVEKRKFS
ncbi:hypothetical protein RUM43_003453 [Polyplax serrata]|uniref:Uncharacterized protein n=1 Tax=Polyplax serrata TaxID=468196 RepID=A0AAN8PHD8_POLSC